MKSPNELTARLLGSEVKAELLVLFHKNPGLIDSVEGIARRIGRTAQAIEKDVQDFAQLKLVIVKKYDTVTAVSLDHKKDKAIQNAILKHLKALSKNKKEGEKQNATGQNRNT